MIIDHQFAFYLTAIIASNAIGVMFGYSLAKARIKRLKARLDYARLGL